MKSRIVALEGLIQKIDTDVTYQPNGPNWPSLLDSFSLIAGQIATLTKYLQNEKTPELRNGIIKAQLRESTWKHIEFSCVYNPVIKQH